jgi:hypothetical protein
MRSLSLLAAAMFVLSSVPLPSLAQSGSGTLWEVGMHMDGMPDGMGFAMPKQRVCMSNDPETAPPPDEGCTILEQRSRGNKHFVKMQCKDGLMEVEQTRTRTTMQSLMKMTDKSGEVTEMTMKGTAVGECDYKADKQAREKQLADMQRKVDDMQRQSAAQLAAMCNDALTKMQGPMFGKDSLCVAQKQEYCKRLGTREGYGVMAASVPEGAESVPGYSVQDQVANCGLDDKALRGKHCSSAVAAADFTFVGKLCPAQVSQLCPQAAGAEKFGYLFAHCPAEKQQFIATNCAGRKYSSQIDARYRDLCVAELGNKGFSNDGSALPTNPAEAVGAGVKEGVKGLKKVFGF